VSKRMGTRSRCWLLSRTTSRTHSRLSRPCRTKSRMVGGSTPV
jgi:hypothetical protein